MNTLESQLNHAKQYWLMYALMVAILVLLITKSAPVYNTVHCDDVPQVKSVSMPTPQVVGASLGETIPEEVKSPVKVEKEIPRTVNIRKYPKQVKVLIKECLHIAQAEEAKFGIPAEIILAQQAEESNWMRSGLNKPPFNNYFGVKEKREGKLGVWYCNKGKSDCGNYRVYENRWESFRDHSLVLKKKRYANLFKLNPSDYQGWAQGLQKYGYAENKKYSENLISIIEQWKLDEITDFGYKE